MCILLFILLFSTSHCYKNIKAGKKMYYFVQWYNLCSYCFAFSCLYYLSKLLFKTTMTLLTVTKQKAILIRRTGQYSGVAAECRLSVGAEDLKCSGCIKQAYCDKVDSLISRVACLTS